MSEKGLYKLQKITTAEITNLQQGFCHRREGRPLPICGHLQMWTQVWSPLTEDRLADMLLNTNGNQRQMSGV